MRFAIDRRDHLVFGVEHLVVKVHEAGERYLVATYSDEAGASECLEVLSKSIEGRAHAKKPDKTAE